MENKNIADILKTINCEIDIESSVEEIATIIVNANLSYRQACAILEYTKDRLQDIKMG